MCEIHLFRGIKYFIKIIDFYYWLLRYSERNVYVADCVKMKIVGNVF